MHDAIYPLTEAEKLMILNVKYSQIESGISEPIMEHPGISISYLSPTWITSVWHYLFQYNIAISLTDKIMTTLCVMWYEPRPHVPPDHHFIQHVTSRQEFCMHATRPIQKLWQKTWPRLEPPSASQLRPWHNYTSSNFLRYSNRWKQSLGHSIPTIPI